MASRGPISSPGEIALPNAVQGVLGARALGSNQKWVCACNPGIVPDEFNMLTLDPHAVRCRDCGGTEIWKAAIAATPHHRAAQRPGEAESMEGCC